VNDYFTNGFGLTAASGNAWTSGTTYVDISSTSDAVLYAGNWPASSKAKSETAVEWLDRRIDELRVSL
jgi:hypothetical protein